ncbi:NAD(P)-dependent dehydrogenase (short-subunit alcohol dehydrogenase family) [Actinoplanes lutulentus]|uniref:NAD(P)-dependent dehydrogenase (Short-subunit alcohol dehydrogenase family) n=1 Tax=Actinoplanes lutulentus TaxID=1287878 RepID=A0A327ZG46_9ACTN|nr:SDR family oxidoreductase [Actinoplanes lutulentus]MBB2947987.1 NAD(P)-dependent dehydrogenase (short-subunit alcohol dehydrogenase family) [Actinoplanes lutulentus]RAK40132.1 NAD(P)-dependent dehydrogenase (short-subunit alcohol dehydrogenase family) [Actinoplanes lutulentus]
MPKIALITGGNRGLGRATALALIDAGVEVIYTYRGDPGEKIDAVALPLTVGDLGSYDAFAGSLRQVLADRFGRTDFDFLVNNAGVGAAGSIAETSVEAFDEMLNVHWRGMFFLTQKLLPLIADGGRIVNLSTGLTRFTGEGVYAAYAAMKGAVEVFTKYLAKELGPRGITANVVAPGPAGTEFGGGALRDNEQVRAHIGSVTALGRVARPEEIAAAVATMLGDGAGWITGQRVEASGGMLL